MTYRSDSPAPERFPLLGGIARHYRAQQAEAHPSLALHGQRPCCPTGCCWRSVPTGLTLAR
ncbi:MAG: hypothetical protein U1F42_01100 [Candidatus Competibacteraceae bacterium]